MEKLALASLCLLILGLLGGLADGATNGEKCEESKSVTTVTASGSNSTIITEDNCDKKTFLTCKDFRCRCADLAFGVFTSKDIKVVVSRSKRSPGKGKGGGGKSKGVSKGAVVGAVAGTAIIAGGAGYIAGQHSQNNNGGSYHSNSGSSGSSRSRDKYTTVYSCYQRVDGDCVIDPSRITTVKNTTITNGTSVTVLSTIDYKDRPECISGAECKSKRVQASDADTNIGECVCLPGYSKTKTDTCVKLGKSGNGAEQIGMSASSLVLTMAALLFKFL